jgi:hypothetical protein
VSESDEGGIARRTDREKRPARGMLGGRRLVFKNLDEERADLLEAVKARFGIEAFQHISGENERLPDFLFIGDKLDFFFAHLEQEGFEFEEREEWD